MYAEDLIAYSNGTKKVYAAHTVITLCKFGRWLSWAIFPVLRFFPVLTDSIDGAMSWEMRAKLSLRPDPMTPILIAAGVGAVLYSAFRSKKGA